MVVVVVIGLEVVDDSRRAVGRKKEKEQRRNKDGRTSPLRRRRATAPFLANPRSTHAIEKLLPKRQLPRAPDVSGDVPGRHDPDEKSTGIRHDDVVHAMSRHRARRFVSRHPRRRRDHRLIRHRADETLQRDFFQPPLQRVPFRHDLRRDSSTSTPTSVDVVFMKIIHASARTRRRRRSSASASFPRRKCPSESQTRRDETRRDETRRDETHPDRSTTVDDDDAPDAVVRERAHDAFELVVRLRRRTPNHNTISFSQSRDREDVVIVIIARTSTTAS